MFPTLDVIVPLHWL